MGSKVQRAVAVAVAAPEAALMLVSDAAAALARSVHGFRTRLAYAASTEEQLRQAMANVTSAPKQQDPMDFMVPTRDDEFDDRAPGPPMVD